MLNRRLLLGVLLSVGVVHSRAAFAQAYLADPRLTNGAGVKAGDFELHPGIAAELGYDSNYFQRSGSAGPTDGRQVIDEFPVLGAYRLRLTPSLTFQTFGKRDQEQTKEKRDLELSGTFAASYNALFATDSKYADEVSNQDHLAGSANITANIGKQQHIGGDLNAGYSRMVEPSNNPELFEAFRRDVIRAGAGINFRPGGGIFTWRFGYGFTANLFEERAFQGYNNLQNQVQAGGTWKFLPRTALLYRGDITFVHFTNDPKTLADGQTGRSQIGLNGLITNFFGLLVLAGWGGTFYENKGPVRSENFDTFIGQVELTWYPIPQQEVPGGELPIGLSSGSIGYTRNYITSYLSNYYQRDRGYIDVVYFFGQKFVFGATAGFSHITRPPAYFPDGSYRDGSAGGENLVDLQSFLEYRIAPTIGVNLTVMYDAALSDVLVQVTQPSATGPALYDDLRFARYQAFLGARWFF